MSGLIKLSEVETETIYGLDVLIDDLSQCTSLLGEF